MGKSCSRLLVDDEISLSEDPAPPNSSDQATRNIRLVPACHMSSPAIFIADNDRTPSGKGSSDQRHAWRLAMAQEAYVRDKDTKIANLTSVIGDATMVTPNAYFEYRNETVQLEARLNFDFSCREQATPLETRVDKIIKALRKKDEREIYHAADDLPGYGGQQHGRFPGDHFLSNVELINRTSLLDVAHRMPKGAHLHIHFNSCLPPEILLNIAKTMDRMFITSDLPLVASDNFANYDRCEIQFSLLTPAQESPGDIFSPMYQQRQTMKLSEFRHSFSQHRTDIEADHWLVSKLVYHEDEAHNSRQTNLGAWEKFNGRTRMMKGLFNYVTAYRRYTRACLEDLLEDNILYAEVRPNFMTSNQLLRDDGSGPIDNAAIMEIIVDEVERYKTDVQNRGGFFGGVKVIYCTPRSFSPDQVKVSLDECLRFKRRWPQWIAGFDLVGEEAMGRPLKDFITQFLDFRKTCEMDGLDIPFLFHCGETLDMGSEIDGNLVDALLLNSRRIGHGYALPKHPHIMEGMKAKGICVELCPISNEVLGLTPRIRGHALYELLANNVHCTVNSDNGAFFRSSLSHDFYQIMVGSRAMGLFGWKQLILWSLEHASLDDAERDIIRQQWLGRWEHFLREVSMKYGSEVEGGTLKLDDDDT